MFNTVLDGLLNDLRAALKMIETKREKEIIALLFFCCMTLKALSHCLSRVDRVCIALKKLHQRSKRCQTLIASE